MLNSASEVTSHLLPWMRSFSPCPNERMSDFASRSQNTQPQLTKSVEKRWTTYFGCRSNHVANNALGTKWLEEIAGEFEDYIYRLVLIGVLGLIITIGGIVCCFLWHLLARWAPFLPTAGDRVPFLFGAALTYLLFLHRISRRIWNWTEKHDAARSIRRKVLAACASLGLGEPRVERCELTPYGFIAKLRVPRGATPEQYMRCDVAFAVWFHAQSVKIRRDEQRADNAYLTVYFADPLSAGSEWMPIAGRVGQTEVGEATWDFYRHPHGLVAGDTGSGKTSCVLSLLATLRFAESPWNWYYFFIDLKRVTFSFARGASEVGGVATTQSEATTMLELIHEEMLKRYELMESHGVTFWEALPGHVRPRPWLLTVDEATVLFAADVPGEESQAGKLRAARSRAIVANIARLGRSSGIHLLVCLQRPDAAILTGEMRDNLGFRVLLGTMSKDGLKMCLGPEGADVVMPGQRGRGVVQGVSGDPTTIHPLAVPLATGGMVALALGARSLP